jgi:hypothetical protein
MVLDIDTGEKRTARPSIIRDIKRTLSQSSDFTAHVLDIDTRHKSIACDSVPPAMVLDFDKGGKRTTRPSIIRDIKRTLSQSSVPTAHTQSSVPTTHSLDIDTRHKAIGRSSTIRDIKRTLSQTAAVLSQAICSNVPTANFLNIDTDNRSTAICSSVPTSNFFDTDTGNRSIARLSTESRYVYFIEIWTT